MNERMPSPAPEQPDQPRQDFAHLPAPEDTYQFPNPPSHEASGEFPRTDNPEPVYRQNEQQPDKETFWKDPRNRGAKIIAGITTAAVVMGGVVFGGQKLFAGHNDDPNEGKRPAATGSANPGEAAPNNQGSPTEVNPTHEVGQRAFSSEMEYTPEGLEIAIKDEDGNIAEVVKGAEAYKTKVQLSTEKYPEAEDAFPAIPGIVNQYVQFGHTPEERKAYDEYTSPEGPGAGSAGVQLDLYTPVFEKAVMADADIPGATLHPPEELIYGDTETPDGPRYNYFCWDRIATRMNMATNKDPSLRPKLVLDTEQWDGGIRVNPAGRPGNDEEGYDAKLFLKTVGIGDATEGKTFELDVTLLRSPDGKGWDIVGGFTTPPEEFVGK